VTVLAAFQGSDFAIIGADSRATDEGGGMFILSNAKVTWDREHNYIFAITGASRGGNLIQQGWTPPLPPEWLDINRLDEFITQDFIPYMRNHFIESGYDAKADGSSAWHDSQFLVALQGVIYPIFEDYAWDRDVRNVYVGGSGGDVALGVMAALEIEQYKDDAKGAAKVVRKAVEIACKWNAYCAPPIVVETQHK
jgi:hypothetical protein